MVSVAVVTLEKGVVRRWPLSAHSAVATFRHGPRTQRTNLSGSTDRSREYGFSNDLFCCFLISWKLLFVGYCGWFVGGHGMTFSVGWTLKVTIICLFIVWCCGWLLVSAKVQFCCYLLFVFVIQEKNLWYHNRAICVCSSIASHQKFIVFL